jgi:hypothetical protein
MRYLKLFALVGVLGVSLLAASGANAQRVAIGVGIGGPGYYGAAPICDYGYYNYYPYACAPYGYYGPEWFDGGFFIGAGPWFRGYYGRGFGRGFDRGRDFRGRDFGGRDFRGGFDGRRGFDNRGSFRGSTGGNFRGSTGGGFRGSTGGGFRSGGGGGSFHGGGGGSFHGGGGGGSRSGGHGGGGHR